MATTSFLARLYGLLWLLLGGGAWAHDFWIEPEPVASDPHQIELRLRVGEDLVGNSVPNIPDWYTDFSASDGSRRFPIARGIGDDPAGAIVTEGAPGFVIGYQNKPEYVHLLEEKFITYLKKEGLNDVVEMYRSGEPRYQRRREFYQRCAKTLLKTHNHSDQKIAYWGESLGYDLELTPLNSPFESNLLKLQLSYNGRPLPNRQVVAFTKEQPEQKQLQISDAEGRVEIKLDRPGFWLVKSVHMIPYEGRKADWISYWASLTFWRPTKTTH